MAYMGPSKFVRIAASAASTSSRLAVFDAPTPAFATSTSHGPRRTASDSRPDRTLARSAASATAYSIRPPPAFTSSHNWRNRSSRRARTPQRGPATGELDGHRPAEAARRPGDAHDLSGEPHTTHLFAGLLRRPFRECPRRLAYFPNRLLGKAANGCHHGKVAFRPYRAFPCGPSSSRPCHG